MHTKALEKQAVSLPRLWFDEPWAALNAWPNDQSFLVLGGGGSRYTLVGLNWDEVPWKEFVSQTACAEPKIDGEGWTTGDLAVVAYQQDSSALRPSASRAFRIRRTLVIDHLLHEAEICAEPDWRLCAQHLPFPAPNGQQSAESAPLPKWFSPWTDTDYLKAVSLVLDEIRSGRYYQLNLLRYWSSDGAISRDDWLKQLTKMGGPFSAYIDVGELHLVSFSPERFFKLVRQEGAEWIETEPIKGTRRVSVDAAEDLRLKQDLMASRKDEAELNMIVDLLRNDLFRICRPSQVEVVDPGSLHSFSNVHHRIARIRGCLKPGLTVGDLLAALCPGGSITGAPKREVMQAIYEKEARPRGFFMGNIVFRDAFTGRLDSSILIRTACQLPDERWEFAAGSGLVVHSDPAEELAEVRVKAGVLPGQVR